LEGGIDGLIHLSDITWAENPEEAIRNFSKGDEIETVVLAVDAERERISLGIKQLEKDPFSSYVAEHPKGTIVKGTAESVDPKGVVVNLADGVEGYLKASEISLDKKIDDARTAVKEGDELEVKITAIDRKKRTINVSVRAKEVDDEAAAVEEYSQESGNGAGTKLGDLLKEHLDSK